MILKGYDETGTRSLTGGEEVAVGDAKDCNNLDVLGLKRRPMA
jgi:hypothetical protein